MSKYNCNNLKYFVLFIGHGRSGHSLVGSLLDAHPNIIISHEYFILTKLPNHRDQESVFNTIIDLSKEQAKKSRFKKSSVYKYDINTKWQGKADKLKVIGDKSAGNVSWILRNKPWRFDQLQILLDIPIKLVHIIRNPYDNIATLSIRNKWDLNQTIQYYMADEGQSVSKFTEMPLDIFSLRLEDLINNKRDNLIQLIKYLEQEPNKKWLNACENLIFDKPSITRHKVDYTNHQIRMIKSMIDNIEHLQGYSYEK